MLKFGALKKYIRTGFPDLNSRTGKQARSYGGCFGEPHGIISFMLDQDIVPENGVIVPKMSTIRIEDTLAERESALVYLFGRTRRRILDLLFNRPDTAFYTNEIVRQVGTGTSSTQNELKMMTAAGIISRERTGNLVLYRVNKDSPLYEGLLRIVTGTAKAGNTPAGK